ncbi:Holin of 3TMs, for gene-transfer release [uncultured Caudovirales phage]|uniref:Holin of 3TMs, for gene-transfer release n=1 Tax=uncultured Caudovirales phage TaxID=2100421 RepID=A0A6J7WGQ1_9CAUD|nr:Holin of 3TMs, for gene-transfer release [uncultured Caudovirales phage]CAB5194858.1 Holin of 3TMs, for gene-transfer release [uncultured Caudovirales phage]
MDPITQALGIGSKLIDRLWPDPAQADAAKLELLKLQQSGELAQMSGQLEINKTEAASSSLWVSGWRPSVGWVCSAACAWNWLGLPIARLVCELLGHPIALAPADLSEMLPVLIGLLGISSLRSLEKINKVA